MENSGHVRVRTASGPGQRCICCSSFCSLFKKRVLIMHLKYAVTALIYTTLLRTLCTLRMPWVIRRYFALSPCQRWQDIIHPSQTLSSDINTEKLKYICISLCTAREVLAASTCTTRSSLLKAVKVHEFYPCAKNEKILTSSKSSHY